MEGKLDDAQIRKINGELSNESSKYYCPDIDQFIMEGSRTFEKTTFNFRVMFSDAIKDAWSTYTQDEIDTIQSKV